MPPLIHLIKHGEAIPAIEGLKRLPNIRDPGLTWDGEKEARYLAESKTDFLRPSITHIVSSPSLCAIRTAIIAFDKTLNDAAQRVPAVILNAQFMEASVSSKRHPNKRKVFPCHQPCPLKQIRARHGTLVDMSLIKTQGKYIRRQPQSLYHHRRRKARQWLRKLAQEYGEDAEIAVISHGSFLQHLTGSSDAGKNWDEAEMRTYVFVSMGLLRLHHDQRDINLRN